MSEQIEITTGEKRHTTSVSIRTFAFAVTSTGYEVPVDTSFVSMVAVAKSSYSQSDRRWVRKLYDVAKPFVLKIKTTRSSHGRPYDQAELVINLGGPEKGKIAISGFLGFGGFTGHGELDLERSYMKTARGKPVKLKEEDLRDVFEYKEIASPKVEVEKGSVFTRKTIR